MALGGPALCLNFGPSSELGVNEGVGSLLVFLFSIFFFFFWFSRDLFFPLFLFPCGITQGPSPFVGSLPSRGMVAACPSQASLNQLRFLSPECFRAGEIHNHFSVWERLLSGRGSSQVDLMKIIKEGVRIDRLFKPFKGNFKGSSYDSLFSPPMRLDIAKVCEQFRDFITDTVVDWVDAGVLAVRGRVGEVTSPHLVLPLTAEPSKPCLYHDERFLNLWIKDLPFRLDHLPDLPRYVLPGQRVLLHPSSRTFFDLEWNGVYFFFFALSRLDGRRVLIYITISVLPLRVQHVRLGFLCRI